MNRPTKDQHALLLARTAALRGSCPRARVGCVIVVDGDAVASGYNGAPAGAPHCEPDGCDIVNGSCVRTVHAELNAICRAARAGVSLKGGTAYVTHEPCRACASALIQCGIRRILYIEARPNDTRQAIEDRPRIAALARALNIQIDQHSLPEEFDAS